MSCSGGGSGQGSSGASPLALDSRFIALIIALVMAAALSLVLAGFLIVQRHRDKLRRARAEILHDLLDPYACLIVSKSRCCANCMLVCQEKQMLLVMHAWLSENADECRSVCDQHLHAGRRCKLESRCVMSCEHVQFVCILEKSLLFIGQCNGHWGHTGEKGLCGNSCMFRYMDSILVLVSEMPMLTGSWACRCRTRRRTGP